MKLRDKIVQVIPGVDWVAQIQDKKTPGAHWAHTVIAWAVTASGELRAVIADDGGGVTFADTHSEHNVVCYERK
jgi:hypothetical protein